MNRIPKVSIGMPVYNGERYVGQALESLLGQTFADFELVISDNASSDSTRQICEELARRDTRVRYYYFSENIGGPLNFSRVFGLCRGNYVKWATADDYWAPQMLEKCVPILDHHPDVVLCHPRAQLVNWAGQKLEDYEDSLDLMESSPSQRFIRLLECVRLCNAHLGVIRADVMRKTKLMGDELASDIHFLAELALYGKFYQYPETLFYRRFHTECSSWDRQSSERQSKYYNPSRNQNFGLHTWKKYLRLTSAVACSEIGAGEKVKALKYLYRQMLWDDRNRMRIELASAVKAYLRSV
ncbi:MAG: glycosyltransferase [Acidobacteriota bacterium]